MSNVKLDAGKTENQGIKFLWGQNLKIYLFDVLRPTHQKRPIDCPCLIKIHLDYVFVSNVKFV